MTKSIAARHRREAMVVLVCGMLWFTLLPPVVADVDPFRLEAVPAEGLDPDEAEEGRTDDVAAASPAVQLMFEGMLLVQDGEHERAVPKLERVIRMDPSQLGAWETLGWAYWHLNREEDARALWERLRTLAPQEPLALNLLAQLATRDGELERALELYRASLQRDPEQFETAFAMAQVLLWSGHREEAVKWLRRVHAWDPERIDVQIELAWALFANEEYEIALAHWDLICEELPEVPDFMAARAEVLIYMGDLEAAEEALRELLEIEPDHEKALNLMVVIAERRGQPEDMLEALRSVIDLAEDDRARAPLVLRLAYQLRILNRREPDTYPVRLSLEAAEEAVRLDPDDVQGRMFFGEALLMDKQFARAADVFKEILEEFNPHNLRARNGLMEAYLARNKVDEGERQLRDNLRTFNDRDPYRHAIWARIHFARGNMREAYEALDRLEDEGLRGAVFNVLYHGLSPSEWTDMLSVRQFREHVTALRDEGFEFITPDEFEPYFEQLPPPPKRERAPWPYRMLRGVRRGFTAEAPEDALSADEISPPKVACIHFDDGLRTSFRWGTPVLEEMGLRAAMCIAVGLVEDRDFYIASWEEIRAAYDTGVWVMGSHLMDSSLLAPVDAEGRMGGILANRIWLEEQGRLETLREFQARLRYEYGRSKEILQRELGLRPEEIIFQVPPMGDIGQELGSNIRLFNVPRMNLAEAEIHYRMGFIQSPFGYALRGDHPQLLQRYEPERDTPARDVVLQAYRGHPVYMARHMRAEFAALQGLAHKALNTVEQLRRDGYPEELLNELNEFVRARLAGQIAMPGAVRAREQEESVSLLQLRHPFLGVRARETKANVQVREQHLSVFAGLELNPRLTLQVTAGEGRLRQTIASNIFYEVTERRTTRRRVVTRDEAGNTTIEDQTVTTFDPVFTNRKETTHYRMDEDRLAAQLVYVFPAGSALSVEATHYRFTGDYDDEDNELWAYAGELQWRPTAFLHAALRYQHDRVPSARELVRYDSVLLRGVWSVRDWWSAEGTGHYASYSDDNAMLVLALENLWQVSSRQDIWLGVSSRLTTSDQESDVYWTPYWEQRHYGIARLRRTFPNFYAALQVNLGWQREKARPELVEEYKERRTRARLGGWYPGEDPRGSWEPMAGVSATLSKRWESGWELGGDVTVNVLREYIERNAVGSLLYRF